MLTSCQLLSKKIETVITSHDGTHIFTIYAPAPKKDTGSENKGTVFFLHGACQHCKKYEQFFDHLVTSGYSLVSFDARGHGKSSGKRGHISSFNDCYKDLESVYNYYKNRIKGPLIVIGHSIGGLIATRYIQQNTRVINFDACITVCPCFGISPELFTKEKETLLKLLYQTVPFLTVKLPGNGYSLTHDQKIINHESHNDPYVTMAVTVGSVKNVIDEINNVFTYVTTIKKPFHIIYAGADNVVDISKIKRFYSLLPIKLDKSLIEYKYMYHSLLHETKRAAVYADITKIISAYI